MPSGGRVDRSGGREGKKSLKKPKQKKYEAEKAALKPVTIRDVKPQITAPPPPIPYVDPSQANADQLPIFDAGCCLLSRQFDRDMQTVIQRAHREEVTAIVTHCLHTDFAKIEDAVILARAWPGVVYSVVGISPDVVKRQHDKLFDARLVQVHELGCAPETVALSCGLDLTREAATHFLQEKLLESQLSLAHRLQLPVLLRLKGDESVEKTLEKVAAQKQRAAAGKGSAALFAAADSLTGAHADGDSKEESAVSVATAAPTAAASAPTAEFQDRFAVYAFAGTEKELRALIAADFYIMISGAICEDSEAAKALLAFLPLIPADRLLLISDSPLSTPQNIEDAHIREGRNEPCNLPYVYKVAAATLKLPENELRTRVYENSLRFYGIRRQTKEEKERMDAPEAAEQKAEQVAAAAAGGEKKPKQAKADKEEKSASKAGKAKAPAEEESKSSKSKSQKGKKKKGGSEDEDEEEAPKKSAGKKGAGAGSDSDEEQGASSKVGRKAAKRAARRASMDSDSEDEKPAASKGGKTKGGKGKAARDESDEEAEQPKLSKSAKANKSKKGKRDDSEDEEEEDVPKPKEKAKQKKAAQKAAKAKKEDSDEEEEDIPLPAKKGRAAKKAAAKHQEESEEEEEEEVPQPKSKSKAKKGKPAKADSEEEEDEEEVPQPKAKGKAKKAAKAAKAESEEEEEEEEEPVPVSKSAKKAAKLKAKGNKGNSDEDEEDSRKAKSAGKKGAKKGASDEEEEVPSKSKAKAKPAKKPQSDEEEEEEEEEDEEEEEEETKDGKKHMFSGGFGSDFVKFACRKCRKVVFTSDDVLPHETPDELRGQARARERERSKKDKESSKGGKAACESIFVRPMAWMIADDDPVAALARLTLEPGKAKMVCPNPKCLQKLGSVSTIVAECACGVLQEPPAYVILRSRVEPLEQIDAASLARGAPLEDPELLTEAEKQELFEREKQREIEDQRRRDAKKTKKQSLDQATKGNFSSFRNKNY